MEAVTKHMTVEEFLAVRGERRFAELIDGVIVVSERKYLHAEVQGRILVALHVWAGERAGRGSALPPTDVILSDRDLY